MQARIINELDTIERRFQVKIVYACESGSRAWGFPSQTSDYDVRFIYRHPPNWYLSILEKRDVIEMPLGKILDINGWDFRKMLRLLYKGNTPLQEWLCSPIVYRTSHTVMTALAELARNVFRPESACHHYLSIAKKKAIQIRSGADAPIKAYLYALRTLLCCQWIIANQTQPPMRIQDLLAQFLPCGEVRRAIDSLMQARKSAGEIDRIALMPVLDEYLNEGLQTLPQQIPPNPPRAEILTFDEVFRKVVINGL